jgi:hypothetical protein
MQKVLNPRRSGHHGRVAPCPGRGPRSSTASAGRPPMPVRRSSASYPSNSPSAISRPCCARSTPSSPRRGDGHPSGQSLGTFENAAAQEGKKARPSPLRGITKISSVDHHSTYRVVMGEFCTIVADPDRRRGVRCPVASWWGTAAPDSGPADRNSEYRGNALIGRGHSQIGG